MSTKATIAHAEKWHLFEELAESRPNNIYLEVDRTEHDGSPRGRLY